MKTIAQYEIEMYQQNLYQIIRVGRKEVCCCIRGTWLVVEYIEILIKQYQQIDIVINTKTISKTSKSLFTERGWKKCTRWIFV